MVSDTNPRQILRGIGRGLDRRYPADSEEPGFIEEMMERLREHDRRSQGDCRQDAKSA